MKKKPIIHVSSVLMERFNLPVIHACIIDDRFVVRWKWKRRKSKNREFTLYVFSFSVFLFLWVFQFSCQELDIFQNKLR